MINTYAASPTALMFEQPFMLYLLGQRLHKKGKLVAKLAVHKPLPKPVPKPESES